MCEENQRHSIIWNEIHISELFASTDFFVCFLRMPIRGMKSLLNKSLDYSIGKYWTVDLIFRKFLQYSMSFYPTDCDCNNQASQCHVETGRCFCTTKGIIGDHCEKCDTQNHYHGDPTAPHGSCFCEYLFNISFLHCLSQLKMKFYS